MADRFIGIAFGKGLGETKADGTFQGVTTGTSTTSKGVELRYATGVGATKQDVLTAIESIKAFIEQSSSIEVA